MASMNWKDIVGTVAPTIATALGGPMAGTAVKFLADKLLGDPQATQDQVAQAIVSASPEKLLELKKLDNDFQVQMRQLDIDLEKLNAADRASARDMAVKNGQKPQLWISAVYTVAYAVVLWAYVSGNIQVPADAQGQFNIVLGALTAAQTQILNFWMGSSSGSKAKDDHLAEIAKAP